uniref:Conotoxin Cal12.5 n=1 Tax=Californiconus californicus TaxID=1736779 RepID=O1C5_CONCL|nr:RecName: Full=Conotoxin Cal12.5; AltName: Full=O1_cal12c; Flags: Precursor [Californiconus californicus]
MKVTCVLVVLLLLLPYGDLLGNSVCDFGSCVHNGCYCEEHRPCCTPGSCSSWWPRCPGSMMDP